MHLATEERGGGVDSAYWWHINTVMGLDERFPLLRMRNNFLPLLKCVDHFLSTLIFPIN